MKKPRSIEAALRGVAATTLLISLGAVPAQAFHYGPSYNAGKIRNGTF